MAGQQLIWQESDRNDLARTAAMFLHSSAAKPLQCRNQGWDTAIFGCLLADYVGITQLVWSIAKAAAPQGFPGRGRPVSATGEVAPRGDGDH